MLHRLLMSVGVILAGLAPVSAQTLVEPIPGQRAHGLPRSQGTSPAARPCPQHGAGFVRLEGSAGCVKISGSVRAEYGVGRGSFGLSTGSASAVSGVAQIETRTPSTFGDVRTVVRGRVQSNTGLETSPVR